MNLLTYIFRFAPDEIDDLKSKVARDVVLVFPDVGRVVTTWYTPRDLEVLFLADKLKPDLARKLADRWMSEFRAPKCQLIISGNWQETVRPMGAAPEGQVIKRV